MNLARYTTEYRKASRDRKDAAYGVKKSTTRIPSGKAPNSASGHGLTLAEQGGRGSVISFVNRATAQPFSGVTSSCGSSQQVARLPARLAQAVTAAIVRSQRHGSISCPVPAPPANYLG